MRFSLLDRNTQSCEDEAVTQEISTSFEDAVGEFLERRKVPELLPIALGILTFLQTQHADVPDLLIVALQQGYFPEGTTTRQIMKAQHELADKSGWMVDTTDMRMQLGPRALQYLTENFK